MRIRISLDEELVREIDRRVGRGHRSAFVADAVRHLLDDRALGAALVDGGHDRGHDWDRDPTAWVREQRHADPARVG